MIHIDAGAYLLSLVMKKVWCSGLSEVTQWILQGQIFMLTEYKTDIRGILYSLVLIFSSVLDVMMATAFGSSFPQQPVTIYKSSKSQHFVVLAFTLPACLQSGLILCLRNHRAVYFLRVRACVITIMKKLHAWFVPTIRHM